jgi:hypothetical protein
MRPVTKLATCSLALLLVCAGCDAEGRVVGSWELATIDGVGPAAAAPLRALFPAGIFGRDTVAESAVWHEYTLDSLVLAFEPGGAFRERVVEAERTLVRQNTFERPDYVSGAFGGDLIRDDGEPAAIDATGTWSLAGDSLVVADLRAQTVDALVARVRQALPDAPEAAVREAAERAVPADGGPRWTGLVRGDRLELRDREGHVFVLRRADTSG